MKTGSLFAGIGGIDLAFERAGFEIAWANEIDAAAKRNSINSVGIVLLFRLLIR